VCHLWAFLVVLTVALMRTPRIEPNIFIRKIRAGRFGRFLISSRSLFVNSHTPALRPYAPLCLYFSCKLHSSVISSVSMLSDKFVLQKAFPATVEALNNLVIFFPHHEIPPDIRKDEGNPSDSGRDQLGRSIRGPNAEIQCNGCSVRANRTADRIFGYGLVGFGLSV
jgi:hypothetical protein